MRRTHTYTHIYIMRLLKIIRKQEASFEETTADNSLQLLENNNYQVKENK